MITLEDYSWLSVLPPLIAILLALKSKQVYLSLLLGIFSGYLIIENWNIFSGIVHTINSLINVFKDEGNTRIIVFTCLVGGLLKLVHVSGGNTGIVKFIERKLKDGVSDKLRLRKIQLYAYATGLILFIETNISILSVGSTFKPIFDRYKIARVKLAYIADSSSAPISVMIPFNAWGAFVMGLLALNGLEAPFQQMVFALPFNFYAITSILLVLFIIVKDKDYFAMQKFIKKNENTKVDDLDISQNTNNPAETTTSNINNLLIPISLLVVSLPVFLIISGLSSEEYVSGTNLIDNILSALKYASGSWAVLMAVVLSIVVLSAKLFFQKVFSINEISNHLLEGMKELLPLAAIMLLAFAIGKLCQELGTGNYLAFLSKEFISKELLPVIIFITSGFIAFSTGTSWGTFAIMTSIAIPMSITLETNIALSIAAVLSGGVFGDHCSPISDTTIISSMASGTNHIDHVKTQLPYALTAGVISTILFFIFGLIYN